MKKKEKNNTKLERRCNCGPLTHKMLIKVITARKTLLCFAIIWIFPSCVCGDFSYADSPVVRENFFFFIAGGGRISSDEKGVHRRLQFFLPQLDVGVMSIAIVFVYLISLE